MKVNRGVCWLCRGRPAPGSFWRDMIKLHAIGFVLGLIIIFSMITARAADPPRASTDAQVVRILKAKLAVRDAEAELAGLASQWTMLQNQLKDIQAKAWPAQQKVTESQKALTEAIAATAKELGLDPARYNFDQEKMTFSLKPAEPVKK